VSSRKVQSIRYASATSGTGSRRHRWMKCSLDEVLVPRVRNNVGKESLRHQQLLLAAHASSPRIKKGRWASQDHKPKERGHVAMSHEATHFMEGIPSIKSCRPRSPVLNEKMTGFSHIGSPQPRQAERKAMAHERTRTKFSAQLRSDVMDAMYAAANAIFCMRNCNCNCAALLRLP